MILSVKFTGHGCEAAPLMPNVRVMDLTGFEQLLSGGWKQFARAWPALSVIRLGGGQICSHEALKALPHILPGIAQSVATAAAVGTSSSSNSSSSSTLQASSSDQTPAAAAAAAADPAQDVELDNWEDAFASASEDDTDHNKYSNSNSQSNNLVTTSSAGAIHADLDAQPTPSHAAAAGVVDCRLKQLKALVWPDVPEEAVLLVQQRCPKVLVNPPMKRDKVTGQYPPRELDVSVALDQPYMDLVGHLALEGIQPANQQQQQEHQDVPMLSLADKFRTAYIQQAARLKEKEWRQLQQQKRRRLKSSHVLRTLNAWLDEPA